MSALDGPLVVVNYKTYPQATGRGAVALTDALAAAAQGAAATVVVAPQTADLYRVVNATDLAVWAQHVDPLQPGNGTGWTLPEAVRDAGATGSLVNHAENRLQLADIGAAVLRLKSLDLAQCVCTNDVATTAAAAAFKPTLLAIEPPELIGGDVSVTSADPGIVADSVKAAKSVDPNARVLCGAGVKTGGDVKAALDLGCDGVLLASGVTKAKDPRAAMVDLVSQL